MEIRLPDQPEDGQVCRIAPKGLMEVTSKKIPIHNNGTDVKKVALIKGVIYHFIYLEDQNEWKYNFYNDDRDIRTERGDLKTTFKAYTCKEFKDGYCNILSITNKDKSIAHFQLCDKKCSYIAEFQKEKSFNK
jgi:hypothetical protein